MRTSLATNALNAAVAARGGRVNDVIELDVDHRHWASEADARRDIFRWIAFYNHRRRHSALGYLSPADYEQTLRSTTLHQTAA